MYLLSPILNFLIDLLVMIIEGLTELLPETPFEFTPLNWGIFGQTLGYFIPIGTMFAHLTMILVAVSLWYAVRWLLRIVRMIR